MHLLRPAALALSAALVLAGCSGSDDEPEAAEPTSTPSASESVDEDGKPVKKNQQKWTISAGEPMTDREVNYLAVCVQWDGYQDGIPWSNNIWQNAVDSKNDLVMEGVNRMAEDIEADGEASEDTTEYMNDLCENVER